MFKHVSIHTFFLLVTNKFMVTIMYVLIKSCSIEANPLEEYISQVVKGEENVLCSLKTLGFFSTSGTEGPPKLIPRTCKSSIIDAVGVGSSSVINFEINSRLRTFAVKSISSQLQPDASEYTQGLVLNSLSVFEHTTKGLPIATADSLRIEEVVKV